MGIFTVKCTNPECGARVRRGLTYCSKCSTPASAGRINCGNCGQEIRASANFCPFCQAKVAVAAQPRFTADRWARQPEDFAARIDIDDVAGWLVKPLIVEHGTKALLFQQGRFIGELPPGRYDMDGLLQKLLNFMAGHAASIVIMDAGDVSLALENAGLWTQDEMEVGTSVQVVVQVKDPDALFQNLIKGRGRVLVDDVESTIADELQMVMAGVVGHYRAEQLFPALDVRYETEAQIRDHVRVTLERLGLELIHLRFVDFVGDDYEELRRQRSEMQVDLAKADLREQRLALVQRLRELESQDKMHGVKDENDLENFIRQTEHELNLKNVIRDDEMQRLKERFAFEHRRDNLLRELEISTIENDHRREEAWQQLLAEERARDERHKRHLERELQTARTDEEKAQIQARIDQIEHEQDMREAHGGLDLLERQKGIEQDELDRESGRRLRELDSATERRIKEADAFSKADAQALIAIVDGAAGEQILKLEEFRAKKGMSPEQLLALAAATSPDAAKAIAEKYIAEGKASDELREQLKQQLTEQRATSESYADRMERIMQMGLEQMGKVAAERARPNDSTHNVVVPGHGSPTVVTGGDTDVYIICPHCKHKTPRPANRCPHCNQPL